MLLTWLDGMDLIGIILFGQEFPLWAVFLIAIIGILVLWKFIKFAIKLLLIVVVFLVILVGLDVLGFFNYIQEIIAGFF